MWVAKSLVHTIGSLPWQTFKKHLRKHLSWAYYKKVRDTVWQFLCIFLKKRGLYTFPNYATTLNQKFSFKGELRFGKKKVFFVLFWKECPKTYKKLKTTFFLVPSTLIIKFKWRTKIGTAMEKGDFCDVFSARDNSLSVICSVILSLYHGCMHVFSHLTDLNLISFTNMPYWLA